MCTVTRSLDLMTSYLGQLDLRRGFWVGLTLGITGCGGADLDSGEDASPVTSHPSVISLTPEQRERAELLLVAAEDASLHREITVVQGTVHVPDTARVLAGSWVEGRVERIHVLEGDIVQVGTPLLRLHSHELAEWYAERQRAEAEHQVAERAVARGRELLAAGAISTAQFEQREATAARTEADLTLARTMLRHLNPDGDDVVIRASRAGTVLRIFVAPGETVLPGAPLIETGNTQDLWISGALPETLAGHVSVGDSVALHFPVLAGATAQGQIIAMGARVDPLLRTLDFRVQGVGLPQGVRLGMLASIHILASGGADPALAGSVQVPVSAVQRHDDGFIVFVPEGDHGFRAVPVEVLRRDAETAILSGISIGSTVVSQGAYTLRAVLEGFLGPEEDA